MNDAPPPFDISPEDWAATPPTVQAAFAALVAVTATYQQQIADLLKRQSELEARLNQHSQNSSKPPSSDPPSAPPRPAKTPRGRVRGAQPGHERHERSIPPPDEINEQHNYYPSSCPSCHDDLTCNHHDVCLPQTQYVWELPVVVPIITAHHYRTVCCRGCSELVTAPRPADVPEGAFGPRVAATVGLFHGRYRISHREVVDLLQTLYNLPISLGSVVNLQGEVSVALASAFDEVQQAVAAAPGINVDETGWKQAGKSVWLWTVVSALATLFCVKATRSAKMLRTIIGEAYSGIVTSDRGRWYMWLDDRRHQLCWAHLIRNLRALAERHCGLGEWAGDVLELSGMVFRLWHLFREGTLTRAELQVVLEPIQAILHALVETGSRRSDAGTGLCMELLHHWEALWTFAREEGLEPTNNAAEQALRPAVLWRKGCFGAQSDAGNRFVERILTVSATCRQQQRHLLTFLTASVEASWQGRPAPSLFPTS